MDWLIRLVVDEDLSRQNEHPIIVACATKEIAEKEFRKLAERELENYGWEDTDKILASSSFESDDWNVSYCENEYLTIIDRCDLNIISRNIIL